MSSESNVGGLPELPPCWTYDHPVRLYTDLQMHAYARAALSARGQPAKGEPHWVLVGERRVPVEAEKPKAMPARPTPTEWETHYLWEAKIAAVTKDRKPPAHGQPVVDAELMKRVLGAPYDGVTVGDFFVYADFSEHDTLGVVRAIVAAALGATP